LENQFKKEILRKLRDIGLWDISGKKAERISFFIGDVWEWSGRIHLLGRKDIWSNIERQIIDSAYMLQFLEEYLCRGASESGRKGAAESGETIFGGKRLADIGSGAGFPGLVWKILRPGLEINLFERKLKTAAFLSREAGALDLKKVTVSGIDVEKYEGDLFDIVTSKAAGRLPAMLPLASGILCEGGLYTTVKGDRWREKEGIGPFSGMVFENENTIPGKRGKAVIFKKTDGG